MDTKTLCLGVLSLGDATGYEIKKIFEQTFSHFFIAGFGSIYPALAELDQTGLVACCEVEQERRPAKKVYRLTEAGRRHLVEALAAQEPRHKVRSEFMVLTFFGHLLNPERLEEVLDIRSRDLAERLEHVRTILACPDLTPGVRFTAGYGAALLEAGLEYIRTHENELLAGSRAGAATTTTGEESD